MTENGDRPAEKAHVPARGPEVIALEGSAPTTENRPPPRRCLVIAAHCDDADYYAGGTIAKWAAVGTHCTILVVTDGSKGSWGQRSSDELRALRREEQLGAAAKIGVASVEFADIEDGFLAATLDLRYKLTEVIRRLRPDIVLSHDPWKPYRLHPDHRACGFAASDAVCAAREPLMYADMDVGAHRPEAIWFFETDAPNHVEAISSTFAAKCNALLYHESQFESTMDIKGRDDENGIAAFRSRMRQWAAAVGKPHGFAEAEAFHVLGA